MQRVGWLQYMVEIVKSKEFKNKKPLGNRTLIETKAESRNMSSGPDLDASNL